jgi:hypothetical protein
MTAVKSIGRVTFIDACDQQMARKQLTKENISGTRNVAEVRLAALLFKPVNNLIPPPRSSMGRHPRGDVVSTLGDYGLYKPTLIE